MMKKFVYRQVLSCILVMLMMLGVVSMVSVFAATTGKTEDGFAYSIIDNEVTITDYTGTATELKIPSEIEGCPVTQIGDYVFNYFTSILNVTIPEGVTSIGKSAFANCYYLTSITIPDTVKTIGTGAFSACESLSNVILPDDLIVIGEIAFRECKSLTSITIPDGVTKIGAGAFALTALKSITIPASVTDIGFKGSGGLGDVALGVFSGCSELTEIIVDIDNPVYDSRNNCNAIIETSTNSLISGCITTVIPDGVEYIGGYAFDNLEELESIDIPSSVTKIGQYAFFNCRNLKSIVLPENLTYIGSRSFGQCHSLKNVTLPDGMETIGSRAFYYCDSLESITIPASVTIVEGSAFLACSSLANVYYGGTCSQWEDITFEYGADDDLTDATIHFMGSEASADKIADVSGYSITLSGNIGVNFFLDLSDAVFADDTAKAVFSYSDTTMEIPITDGVKTENGYRFTCEVPAKNMTSEITCTVVSCLGNSKSYTYSVKDYAEVILANPELYGEATVNLVKSMLNYGAAAQEHFGYKTNDLANNTEYMTSADKTVVQKDFSNLSYTLTKGSSDVVYYGTALSLKSEVAIKHYFTLAEGVDASTLTVTVNGEAASLAKSGDLYMLIIPDIAAHNLYNKYVVEINDMSLSYCAMDYAATAQKMGNTELLKVMYALDAYAQSALAYLN